MSILLATLFVTLPLNAFGRVVAGSLVTPADLVGALIAVVTIERLAAGRYRLRHSVDKSILAFVIFIVLGTISIIFSADVSQIVGKGLVQVVGVAIMVLTCIATVNEVSRRPVLFVGYLRLGVVILAITAAIGIVQFVFANALGQDGRVGFGFLNGWAGGNVWYSSGSLDGIVRANSILQEPSALGMVLGLGAGASLIRLGLLRGRYRDPIKQVIPAWTAAVIIAGFLVTVSLIDFLLLAIVATSAWPVSQRITLKTIVNTAVSVVLLAAVGYMAISRVLPELREKLEALGSIAPEDFRLKRAEDLSAIALAANLGVMQANLTGSPMLGAGLGAHPITYDRENPGLGRLPAGIVMVGLNKEDAASLLIRLLSESGILGSIAFIAGWILAIARARRSILVSLALRARPDAFVSLAIAVTASMIGIGVACLIRAPQYYAPWFWLPMALTLSVPKLIDREFDLRGRVASSVWT